MCATGATLRHLYGNMSALQHVISASMWQVVDVFIRCSTVPIAVVAPMYAPFYDSTARERLPETDPLLSFSVQSAQLLCVVSCFG